MKVICSVAMLETFVFCTFVVVFAKILLFCLERKTVIFTRDIFLDL